MIKVESLTKRYGEHRAVEDVSFEVRRGEVVGFLGPNGAGKTTTLRMITGYLRPTSGKVSIGGFDMATEAEEARQLFGYMCEGVPLYRELRVSEYLRHRAEIKGIPRRQRDEAIDRALRRADIHDVAYRIIGQLSKGYRQRVGLADALLADPPLLVLDEPSAGLDPNQIRHVRGLIRDLAGDKTIFLSTHMLSEAEATCDRVVIVRRGRIVAQGIPDALRDAVKARRVVHLSTRAPLDALRAVIDGAEGALWIDGNVEQGTARARVSMPPGDEHIEALFFAIAAADLSLTELRSAAPSLEEAFAELTQSPSEPS